MSDYCHLEVVPEISWAVLARIEMELLRQELAIRLYNSSNNHSMKCSQNVSLCTSEYKPADEVYPEWDYIVNQCADPNAKAEVSWNTYYLHNRQNPIVKLALNCNNPRYSSASSVKSTFEWLTR